MEWCVSIFALSQADLAAILKVLKFPLVLVWIFSALGLFGRLPIFLTGLGFAFYVGCTKSCGGPGHTYDLPMYVLLACGFLLRPDKWSLDFLIARIIPQWPFNPEKRSSCDLSGFLRKLVLLLSVYTLFAAGVAKIWQGGLAWLDGRPLHTYIGAIAEPRFSFSHDLVEFLLRNPPVLMALSIWTICLEIGVILTLFFPRLRWPFFINAWLFHLGIFLILRPRYWPQMSCYLLLVPWEAFRGESLWKIWRPLLGLKIPPSPGSTAPLPGMPAQTGVVISATLLCAILLTTILSRREWFPMTHIPMYSSYVSDERIDEFKRSEFGTPSGLRQVASLTDNHRVTWWSKFEMEKRVQLYGRSQAGDWNTLATDFPGNIVDKFLWAPRLRDAVLDDMRQPGLSVEMPNTTPNTQRTLDSIRERILSRKEWLPYDEFALLLKSDEGETWVLAKISRYSKSEP